jgi:hypothetical protein
MSVEAIPGLVLLVSLGMNIYTAIDARATPDEIFTATHRSRRKWMTLSLFGAFLLLVGVVIAGYYLLRVRPDLRREIRRQGVDLQVSARVKFTSILVPALCLAVAAVLATR